VAKKHSSARFDGNGRLRRNLSLAAGADKGVVRDDGAHGPRPDQERVGGVRRSLIAVPAPFTTRRRLCVRAKFTAATTRNAGFLTPLLSATRSCVMAGLESNLDRGTAFFSRHIGKIFGHKRRLFCYLDICAARR
jgi:hypothetical protein